MKYLIKRLTPLMKDVSDKGKVYCDPLTQEMADQAETIRKAGYDLKGMSKQDVICVEKFTNVYNQMCVAIIAVENGKTKEFDAAAKTFNPRFNRYADILKINLGDEKYALLSKEVEKNIKKLSVKESSFPSVSQLSLSYAAALRAD